MSIEEGIRLFKSNQTLGARSVFERVANEARAQNDRLLEARALGNLGACSTELGDDAAAIPAYERAVELFRSAGRREMEHGALMRLEECYRKTGDNDGVTKVVSRKNLLRLAKDDSAALDLESNDGAQKEKGLLSSMWTFFHGEKQKSDHGRAVLARLAGEQDTNEEYFLQHLMQIRFRDLPFEVIQTRMKRASESLHGVNQLVETIMQATERVNAPLSQLDRSFVNFEDPGTTRNGLEVCIEQLRSWVNISGDASKHIRSDVMKNIQDLRQAYGSYVVELLSEDSALANRVSALRERRSQLGKLLAKKRDKEKSLSDLSSRSSGAAEDAAREVEKVVDDLNRVSVRLEEAKLQHKLGRKKICDELELVEQRRLDAEKSCLAKLIHIQLDAISSQQASLRAALEQIKNIDRSSDLRAFNNTQAIRAYLDGLCGPEVLIGEAVSTGEYGKDESSDEAFRGAIETILDDLMVNNSEPDIGKLCDLFQQRKGREILLQCLNKYRSKAQDMETKTFEHLTVIMIAVLDSAYIEGDIRSAKVILILSETFYHTLEDGTREYVQDRLKGHAMWRSNHFWEEAFFLSVREEVERNCNVEYGDREMLRDTYMNILFGQIGSYAFNMTSCGVEYETVQQFVNRMCISNNFSSQERIALLEGIEAQRNSN